MNTLENNENIDNFSLPGFNKSALQFLYRACGLHVSIKNISRKFYYSKQIVWSRMQIFEAEKFLVLTR